MRCLIPFSHFGKQMSKSKTLKTKVCCFGASLFASKMRSRKKLGLGRHWGSPSLVFVSFLTVLGENRKLKRKPVQQMLVIMEDVKKNDKPTKEDPCLICVAKATARRFETHIVQASHISSCKIYRIIKYIQKIQNMNYGDYIYNKINI